MSAKHPIVTYLLGGTGINVGLNIKAKSRVQAIKESYMVGLDSGGNNPSNNLFPVVHMKSDDPDAPRGSGKVRSLNYPLAEAFVEQVLSQHKPGDRNIIVCNTAGGTGSMLAIVLLRKLVRAGKSAYLFLVNDFTSTWEMKNAIDTMSGLQNQTLANQLNAPVIFADFYNTEENNRGEVNDVIVDRMDHLGLVIGTVGAELDHQDIHNIETYNKSYNVPAAMSRLQFFDQKTALSYSGKPPVAVISLFEDTNLIVPRFQGAHVRATGVFSADQKRPTGMTELHMVLDHGEYVTKLKEDIQSIEDKKVQTKSVYKEQQSVGDADESGMVF